MCGGGMIPADQRLVGDRMCHVEPRPAGVSQHATRAEFEAAPPPDRQAGADAEERAMQRIFAFNQARERDQKERDQKDQRDQKHLKHLQHAQYLQALAPAAYDRPGEIASSKSPPVPIVGTQTSRIATTPRETRTEDLFDANKDASAYSSSPPLTKSDPSLSVSDASKPASLATSGRAGDRPITSTSRRDE